MKNSEVSTGKTAEERRSLLSWLLHSSCWTFLQKMVMFSLLLSGLSIFIAYPCKGQGGIIADGLAVAGFGCFVTAMVVLFVRKIKGNT